jgi:tetratricopeptide (TPR) repeat protein
MMKNFLLTFRSKQTCASIICFLFVVIPIAATGLVGNPESSLNAVDNPRLVEASKAFAEGRFQESAALFSSALKIWPTDASIYCGRGMAYEMINQDQKAVEDYRKALEIDPENYEAMENLAGIYERGGDRIIAAIGLYKRALILDPRPDWKDTLPVWIATLETRLRPETATAVGCWNAGNREAVDGRNEQAEKLYSGAININPSFYQAYFSRGLIRLKLGDLTGALADFEQTGSLAPSSRGWLAQSGIVHKLMGNPQKALEDLRQAVTLDPTDPLALYELGAMLDEKNESGAASELYQKALSLRPDPSLRKLIERNKSKREPRDQRNDSILDKILKLLK